ncbi:MAG: 2-C-methyl-D-erythritol 4-phosphate cytidylyltransferase [Marinifilaceae bacterium]
MKNVAILLAGGSGKRLGADVPKQFLPLAGRTVIEHSVAAFEQHPHIDAIIVVIHKDFHTQIHELIAANGWQKVCKVLSGGSERYHSSLAAINALDDMEDANILIHDAVRPMVSSALIDRVISALTEYRAVNVGVPVVDTILQIDDNNLLKHVPVRSSLRRAQTPQGFKLSTITQAYKLGMSDEFFNPTDDCSVVLKYMPEVAVYVAEGEERNIKITYKEDIEFVEHLLNTEK